MALPSYTTRYLTAAQSGRTEDGFIETFFVRTEVEELDATFQRRSFQPRLIAALGPNLVSQVADLIPAPQLGNSRHRLHFTIPLGRHGCVRWLDALTRDIEERGLSTRTKNLNCCGEARVDAGIRRQIQLHSKNSTFRLCKLFS